MNRAVCVAPLFLVALPLSAQKAEVRIDPAKSATRFTVEVASKVETDRKVLIDGEEAGFGRRGGGHGLRWRRRHAPAASRNTPFG